MALEYCTLYLSFCPSCKTLVKSPAKNMINTLTKNLVKIWEGIQQITGGDGSTHENETAKILTTTKQASKQTNDLQQGNQCG